MANTVPFLFGAEHLSYMIKAMVEEANPKAVQLFDISERRQAKGEINNGKQ